MATHIRSFVCENKSEYQLLYKFVLVTIMYFSPYEVFSCCSLSVPNVFLLEIMASYIGLLASSFSQIEVLLMTIIYK